jgi:hypothetical protein
MSQHPRRQHRQTAKLALITTAVLGCISVVAVIWLYWYRAPTETLPIAFAGTIAGLNNEFGEAFGIAVREGAIYVSDGEKGEISVIRDGVVNVFAAGLDTPSAIALTPDGTLITADAGTHSIRSINAQGQVSTVAGTDRAAGDLDGPAAAAQFRGPMGLSIDPLGKIYVADTYNDRIRVIDNGVVSTLAGSTRGFADGVGTGANFDTPTGLAVWQNKVLVADSGNRKIRVVEPNGSVWTLAGSGASGIKDGLLSAASFARPSALAVTPGGDIIVADGNAIRMISGIVPTIKTLSGTGRGFGDGPLRRSRFSRPSSLVLNENGDVLIADADNRVVRILSTREVPTAAWDKVAAMRITPDEFRSLQPPRWPYDPPQAKRDIAGTLGELRGEIKPGDDDFHFHNGLDIAGSYGETARFVRTEKVLSPLSSENFGTSRELIRLPTVGYIHIRLGRDASGKPFGDDRFLFERDPGGKLTDIRVPRGSYFKAGDPIGTLNSMNHVHLIAGRSGREMNAIDALAFPGISDSRPPTIDRVTIADQAWQPLSGEGSNSVTKVQGNFRVIMRAFDQVDGNSDRRRLGLYKAGFQILKADGSPVTEEQWNIVFNRLPPGEAVPFVYANGSRSGATGETIFNYIVTNHVAGDNFSEGFFDASTLPPGEYTVRALAADYFGNTVHSDVRIVR